MFNNMASVQECFDQKIYTLTRNTSAIQAVADMDGNARLGMILQLPEGTQVRVCGEGFNERTVRVCWEGGFYYIFTEDLEQDTRGMHKAPEQAAEIALAHAAAGSRY